MKSLDKPIALVEAQNTGNASRASDTVTIGLASDRVLVSYEEQEF